VFLVEVADDEGFLSMHQTTTYQRGSSRWWNELPASYTTPAVFLSFFSTLLESVFWFSKPFQWVNRRLGNKKDTWKPIAAFVQPISCACLRSDGHRKMSNQKRAQGEKKLKN
jgi:hypothetical protein